MDVLQVIHGDVVDFSGYANKDGDFWSGIFDNLINVGTGGLSGLISGLFGGIFNIGCWGSQAFDKGALEQQMGYIRTEYNRISSPADIVNVNRMLGGVNYIRYKFEKAITQYKNACSKQLATELVNVCKTLVDSVLPLYEYYTKTEQYNDVVEGNITVIQTIVTALKNPNTTTLPDIPTPGSGSTGNGGVVLPPSGNTGSSSSGYNPNGSVNDYNNAMAGLNDLYNGLPALDRMLLMNFSTKEGISLDDVKEYFFGGQIRIESGKVIWSASAGNAPENDGLMSLLMWGGIGFLAYKLILKK